MGTKLYPGKHDCYEKAESDEPMFVLLARDIFAPDVVEIWCKKRLDLIVAGQAPDSDLEKVREAKELAKRDACLAATASMTWRQERREANDHTKMRVWVWQEYVVSMNLNHGKVGPSAEEGGWWWEVTRVDRGEERHVGEAPSLAEAKEIAHEDRFFREVESDG